MLDTTRRHSSQRGAALTVVAVFLVVILGFVAVGVDVARLAHTATEVQSVADVAARAGAKGLADAAGVPNAGIARAQLIAAKNVMNGDTAPAADVLVDEGHYDGPNKQFECCTNNTPCCAGGQWGDIDCVAANSCTKRSAVLALPHTDVDNLFAGIFDSIQGGRFANAAVGDTNATTRVEKAAIATPSGPAVGCQAPPGCGPTDWQCFCNAGVAPCLPLAAPSCAFPTPCFQQTCQLPSLTTQSPNTDTANWHGFQDGHNANTVRGYLEQGPCQAPGNPSIPGEQSVFGEGNHIDLTNGELGGAANQPYGLMQCIVANNLGCAIDGDGHITGGGGTVFTIPIYDATNCSAPASGQKDIVGFATVRITNVVNAESNRRIDLQTLSRTTPQPPTAGGGCFGTDCRIVLAR
jgi:hypothetical protein